MEDLWSSPWAAEAPAKLDDFPAAPQTVHFPVQQQQQQQQQQVVHHTLPRKISQNLSLSPWNDDDAYDHHHNHNSHSHHHNAWGAGVGFGNEGWSHAIYNGGGQKMGGSSVWRKSPALRPLDAGLPARQPSPDPWREVELDRSRSRPRFDEAKIDESRVRSESDEVLKNKEVEGKIEEKEEEQRLRGDDEVGERVLTAQPVELELEKQDAWTAEEGPESDSGSGSGSGSRSGSSDLKHSSISEDTFTGLESDSHHVVEKEAEKPLAEVESGPKTTTTTNPSPDTDSNSIKAGDGSEPAVAVSEDTPPPQIAAQPSLLFPIDFAALDALFPTTGHIDTRPEPVPDVIIDDTFTTISERKTWYRISRYGSSRKHDSGEDDNYMRVSWANSEVRERTLKTVRRWMEEDAAHGGRVLLGGRSGASGASLFNWDSKAPPVEIAQLLSGRGQKQIPTHARHASVIMPPVGAPSSESEPVKKRPVSMIQLGASATSPGAQSFRSPALSIEPLSPPFRMPSALHSPHTTSPIRPSNLKTVKLASDSNSDSEDDDDEWGEMVGTPTVEADHAVPFEAPVTAISPPPPPPIAPSNTIPHTKPKPIPAKIHTNIDPAPSPSSPLSTPLWDLDLLEDTWGSSALSPSPKPPSMTHSFSTGHATPTTPTSRSAGDSMFAAASAAAAAAAANKPHAPLSPLKYSFSAAEAAEEQQPSAATSPATGGFGLEEEMDMDVVASVVQNLPDLTYMLR